MNFTHPNKTFVMFHDVINLSLQNNVNSHYLEDNLLTFIHELLTEQYKSKEKQRQKRI
jgi:hypothetical protein